MFLFKSARQALRKMTVTVMNSYEEKAQLHIEQPACFLTNRGIGKPFHSFSC